MLESLPFNDHLPIPHLIDSSRLKNVTLFLYNAMDITSPDQPGVEPNTYNPKS